MNDHYLVDVETQVRRIDPDLDLDTLRFDLTTSQNGITHLGWCHEHQGVTPVQVGWKELHRIDLCEGITHANTNSILANCTDKILATAVEIMLDLDRFAHRESAEIRADVSGLDDVVETAYQVTRFEDEVWDMFAPAMSAIPARYDAVLQPVAQSIGDRIDTLVKETIGHPDLQRHLVDYHGTGKVLDLGSVTVALGGLWLFNPRSGSDKHDDVVYATVRSFIPEIRSQRALVTIPKWLDNILRDEVPALVMSEPYETLDAVTMSTALALWSEAEDEPYHEFDRCVEAARLVNR
jgi:hypothetical protein